MWPQKTLITHFISESRSRRGCAGYRFPHGIPPARRFSGAETPEPVLPAQDQEKKPYSILNFYRSCLALRKSEETLLWGTYREYFRRHPKLFMYERRYKGEVILVVCSFSDKPLIHGLEPGTERRIPLGKKSGKGIS